MSTYDSIIEGVFALARDKFPDLLPAAEPEDGWSSWFQEEVEKWGDRYDEPRLLIEALMALLDAQNWDN